MCLWTVYAISKALVDRRLLVVKLLGSQKLYADFTLLGKVSVPNPHIAQGSTIVILNFMHAQYSLQPPLAMVTLSLLHRIDF